MQLENHNLSFKFQLFSDIHLEYFRSFPKITPLAPYLFLAGDIGKISDPNFKLFFDYCSIHWKKIFFVAGNHEYYSSKKTHVELRLLYKDFFNAFSNVYLLDDCYVDIDEFRIYGSTFWSHVESTESLNDFKKIQMKNGKGWTVNIDKHYFNQLHEISMKNLMDQIHTTENKKFILMTHFPPLPGKTSHPKYKNQSKSIQTYFSNDLTGVFFERLGISESEFYSNIKVWVSGHTHFSYDFYHYDTRMIANQFGYPSEYNENGLDLTGVYEI
jgi:predicted phosphohydrolase